MDPQAIIDALKEATGQTLRHLRSPKVVGTRESKHRSHTRKKYDFKRTKKRRKMAKASRRKNRRSS